MRRRVVVLYEPSVHELGIFVEAIQGPEDPVRIGLAERLSNFCCYSCHPPRPRRPKLLQNPRGWQDCPALAHADGTVVDTVIESNRVWTGTVESGNADVMIGIFVGVFIQRTCGNWTIPGQEFGSVTGMTGTIGVATRGWSFSGDPVTCATPLRLFCVQQ